MNDTPKRREEREQCQPPRGRELRMVYLAVMVLADRIGNVETAISKLIKQGAIMAKTFQDLQASVTKLTSASKSIQAVLSGIVEKLKACETVTDFETVTNELDANTKELTDAVVANTPVENPPA